MSTVGSAVGFILSITALSNNGLSTSQLGPFTDEQLCNTAATRIEANYKVHFGGNVVVVTDCLQSSGVAMEGYLNDTFAGKTANAAMDMDYQASFQADLINPERLSDHMKRDPSFLQFVRNWFAQSAGKDNTQSWLSLSDAEFIEVIKKGDYLPPGYREGN